ncbi:hypothetical protein CHS0354_029323 [Potamilus streckersoni]|uniref:WD repeat-containing protein 93 n=1 Tax=Potamilus streckersoni TaxID=2493646 RepID=A0AAE0T2A8_9BIVA|nr:hypothetical protein CHS0354_029323 [Potamilus streckersoni]
MPVYIRKNVSYTPPSLDRIPVEDEDDYLLDPEQLRDTLPQPYRMVDKVLNLILEEVWNVISKREEKRMQEARKVKPPRYQHSAHIEGAIPGATTHKLNVSYTKCMCDSVDGKYVFLGLPSGVLAIDGHSQQILAFWEDEHADITLIKAYLMGEQLYLIVTIDDMGIARLFSFLVNKIYLLKVLNEQSPDIENKILVSKIEASLEGDYLGAVLENPSTLEMWFEIHKLPREDWCNQFDSIMQALRKAEDRRMIEETEDVEQTPKDSDVQDFVSGTTPAETIDPQSQVHQVTEGEATGTVNAEESPPSDQDGQVVHLHTKKDGSLMGDYKFSQPQILMKVKAPQPITGNHIGNLYQACQKVDTGEVIGMGHNNIVTPAHLDLRKTVFEHLHEDLLKYLPKDEEQKANMQQMPNFHFLNPGRMIPIGLEQPNLADRPVSVALWWPGSTNLLQYSLLKTSKDQEFKPDLVWPVTCKITATAVSQDTSLLAIGLENGNVIVWDRYLGIQRGVVNVTDSSAISQMTFLDPSICPQEDSEYPPYPTKIAMYILVWCRDSSVHLLHTTSGFISSPTCVSPPVENDSDYITIMEPIAGLPDLILTVINKGIVQIRDILKGIILFEIKVPETHELTTPWEPVYAIGGLGQMLYVKGTLKENNKEGENESGLQTGSIFVYHFRSFPSLDNYMKKKRDNLSFKVHTTINQRVDALLQERITLQALRKVRMQERWSRLKDEIPTIENMKITARRKERPLYKFVKVQNPFYKTPGSVGWNPVLDDLLTA